MSESFDFYFEMHLKEMSEKGNFSEDYYRGHKDRFFEIFKMIPESKKGGFAIELGATSFFQPLLRSYFNYERVMGTIFSHHSSEKNYVKNYSFMGNNFDSEIISIDLESDFFPLEKETANFVLCSEVIEHLDIDPMYMLAELNRVLVRGGQLLLTTPNSCSARNFWKIANGYRPHFFMQYEKSRSPYRHNIEWDIHGLVCLLKSAGFGDINVFTKDVFESASKEGIELLKNNNLQMENRGDCIFLTAKKITDVVERWPDEIYV